MIVHVTDCFHPRLGGIEVQVGELAKAQIAAGEQVQVVTATPDDGTRPSDLGYPVHRVVAPLPWELPLHPRAGRHLAELFRALRPDVVHVHVGAVSPFAWSAVRCALRHRLPTVVSVHSMWDPVTRGIYRTFEGLTRWSGARMVVAAVSSAAAQLVHQAAPRARVTVVPNGITPDDWRTTARERDGAVHVVAVGRLAPRKQPMTLLEVLRAAHARLGGRVPLRATIAGSGPATGMMERYLGRHGMTGWVRRAGRLGRDGVRALLSTADVFVNPTVRESFGIAALEARTAGVPVVARAGTGVADFVCHEREGLLCLNPNEMVNAIVRLAAEPELRMRIASHNRSTPPEHCTWPAVTEAFRRCYAQATMLANQPLDIPRSTQQNI
ncbi:glycosyl transferase [Longimycelium tulufanense]|uniref:Glycosyl transferase n=1 Tax=Longimycelium tulufanense TaxID=907463 RepID=A0A8J3C754_9PSEU|nr:glycosyltransferase family 4 protein [Longimycelium tulufanense]GGM46629.1 glycosyl transferase [Longimycelium tulufanense]